MANCFRRHTYVGFRDKGSATMDVNRLKNCVMGQVGGAASHATNTVKKGGMPTGLVGGARAWRIGRSVNEQ